MAIKVNGTTVIDDSRALKNIASLDAATAAAITAAGVGGGATLVSSLPSSGSNGDIIYNTSDRFYYGWNNFKSAWEQFVVDPAAGPNTVSGNQIFTAGGNFAVPSGVNNFSVVAVGHGGVMPNGNPLGGGGGGGALGWASNVPCIPGQVYQVIIGTASGVGGRLGSTTSVNLVGNTNLLEVTGGQNSILGYPTGAGGAGGQVIVGTGGSGGAGGDVSINYSFGGGGGAGGYSGNGGAGGKSLSSGLVNATNGSGGGGGGAPAGRTTTGHAMGGQGGGGVGLYGQGSNGAPSGSSAILGASATSGYGTGGSGGTNGVGAIHGSNPSGKGGTYGGGGGRYGEQYSIPSGANSAVRFVWKSGAAGTSYFPNTNVS